MASIRVDLVIPQGTTYIRTFKLLHTDGAPINLAGSIVAGQMRERHYSPDAISLNAEVIDPAQGRIRISLSVEDTRAIPFVTGVYDLKWVDTNNFAFPMLHGTVKITPEVTKNAP